MSRWEKGLVRGDGAAPEFTELDDWIQHGMYDSQQRLGNTWQARFDALPRTKFIWSAGRGPVITGWWQASQDAVGRRYPFLLAARLSSVSTNNFPAHQLGPRVPGSSKSDSPFLIL